MTMYMNEMSKIKERVLPYLKGKGMDIGGYNCKIMPAAFCVDGRDAEGIDWHTDDLYNLPRQLPNLINTMDYLFSSHTLEHLHNTYRAIYEWSMFLKSGGYLILYLPEGNGRYDNSQNMEHLQDTQYKGFMMWFERVFCGTGLNFKGEQYMKPTFEIVEHGVDPEEEDLYSFYLVARKL